MTIIKTRCFCFQGNRIECPIWGPRGDRARFHTRAAPPALIHHSCANRASELIYWFSFIVKIDKIIRVQVQFTVKRVLSTFCRVVRHWICAREQCEVRVRRGERRAPHPTSRARPASSLAHCAHCLSRPLHVLHLWLYIIGRVLIDNLIFILLFDLIVS